MGLLVLWAYWCYVSTGAMCLLVLWAYRCCGPTGAMCLLVLWAYWRYVPTGAVDLLVLCAYRCYVPTGAVDLLVLCAYRCYVPTGATCLLVNLGVYHGNWSYKQNQNMGIRHASEKYPSFNYNKRRKLQSLRSSTLMVSKSPWSE